MAKQPSKVKVVKSTFEILGKPATLDYSPMSRSRQKEMKKASDIEIGVALDELPNSVQEGVTPAQRERLLNIANKKLAMVKKLRRGN